MLSGLLSSVKLDEKNCRNRKVKLLLKEQITEMRYLGKLSSYCWCPLPKCVSKADEEK